MSFFPSSSSSSQGSLTFAWPEEQEQEEEGEEGGAFVHVMTLMTIAPYSFSTSVEQQTDSKAKKGDQLAFYSKICQIVHFQD